jgi:sugar phosphate isomerase/epimerase
MVVAGRVGAAIDSDVDGVMIGAQSYSFRDRPLDACIQAYVNCGLGYAELWQGHLEPTRRDELQSWRTSAPASLFRAVRQKFDRSGVRLYAYTYSFRDEFTDNEIEYGFKMARWLGVNKITASANVSTAGRIDHYAQRYKVYVGLHNHASMAPNEFSRPADFATALRGRSEYMRVNLDIGHATAAGWDPVEYLAENHARIITLHLKDRKPNHDGHQGDNVPWGEGSTNIKGVLSLLEKYRWRIPAMIEYEYKGRDSVAEVKRCFDYCRRALS